MVLPIVLFALCCFVKNPLSAWVRVVCGFIGRCPLVVGVFRLVSFFPPVFSKVKGESIFLLVFGKKIFLAFLDF